MSPIPNSEALFSLADKVEIKFNILGVEKALKNINEIKDAVENLGKQKIPDLGTLITGNLASNVITKALDIVKDFSRTVVEVAKDAVLVGAAFEKTEKGLAVFTGGIASARAELAALGKTVENIPGLKLPDAEAGYNRLRALGFQAQVSTDIVKGLAVQTQLVGASSLDVQRVITNLIQLSAGSQRASQDVREIIHSIPSLRGVFEQAFGTAEGKELGKIFSQNPSQALDKFAEALGKAKNAAPGLSSALVQLENSYTQAQRAFAEPLLAPLTDSIKILSDVLKNNTQDFRDWGRDIANVIRYVNSGADQYKNGSGGFFTNLGKSFINSTIGGAIIYDQYRKAVEAGQKISEKQFQQLTPEQQLDISRQENVRTFLDNPRTQFLPKEAQTKTIQTLLGISDNPEEIKAAIEKNLKSIGEVAAKEVDRELKGSGEARKSHYNLLESQIKSHLTTTKNEEITQIKQLRDLRTRELKDEIAETVQAYQVKTALAAGNSGEQLRLIEEQFRKTSILQNEIKINQINAQTEIARKEREIFEERRREAEKLAKLQQDLFSFRRSTLADISGNAFQNITAEGRNAAQSAYERFLPLGAKTANEVAALENQKTAKKLKDEFDSQINQVRSLAYSSSDNPFVRFFGQAKDAIDRARQATKFLGKDLQDATMKLVREGNANALFDLRADTVLGALGLRQKANQILNPYLQINEADILRQQYYEIQNLKGTQEQKDRVTANLFSNANPLAFPNELRGIAYDALNRESERRLKFEEKAEKLFTKFESIISDAGMKVNVGEGQDLVRIVNEAPGSAKVERRARQSDTNSRYQ